MKLRKNHMWRRGGIAIALALACGNLARADVIAVDAADWSDIREVVAGEIVTAGPWSGDPVTFSWEITFDSNTDLYTYEYTLNGWGGPASGLSHWDLTTSDGREGTEAFTEENVFAGTSDFIDEIGELNSGQFLPPTDSYGIRWNKQQDAAPQTYVLVTDRAPIWGSFYAKSGGGTAVGGYNSGWFIWSDFLADTDIENFVFNKNQWVAVPDTHSSRVVPEPSSFVLASIGLVGAGFVMRRRARSAGVA